MPLSHLTPLTTVNVCLVPLYQCLMQHLDSTICFLPDLSTYFIENYKLLILFYNKIINLNYSLEQICTHGVLGFWGFGVLGLGFRV